MATAPTPLEHAAASAQQSVSITDVVAVRGGGIKLDATLERSWIVIPEDVDGYRFFEVHANYHCKQYLNANFRMVERLQKQRNAKAAALMRAAAAADLDPHCGGWISPEHMKKELIDKIPKTIEVEVETRNGVQATVRVLPSWRESSVLQLELTQDNLDLLLEEPRPEETQFTPTISQPDVAWVKDRNYVRCRYWSSRVKKWKTRSRLIDFDSDMDDDKKQELVDIGAIALQRHFNANHNRAGNLECLRRVG
jgi:hypothetical protein